MDRNFSNKAPQEKGLKRIIYAAKYSYGGLCHALRNEAAFRQELYLSCLLVPLAVFLPLSIELKLFLILCNAAVLVVELLNSAVEAVVDKASPEIHPLARQAKDMGSAAVFISLIALAGCWAVALFTLCQ